MVARSLHMVLAGGKIRTILREVKDEAGRRFLHLQLSRKLGFHQSSNP